MSCQTVFVKMHFKSVPLKHQPNCSQLSL